MKAFKELLAVVLQSQMYADMPAADQKLVTDFFNGMIVLCERYPDTNYRVSVIEPQLRAMAELINAARPLKKYPLLDMYIDKLAEGCRESVAELEEYQRSQTLTLLGAMMGSGRETSAFMN